MSEESMKSVKIRGLDMHLEKVHYMQVHYQEAPHVLKAGKQ